MNQDCTNCPAQKQCWSRFTELNLLACRVRFTENSDEIFRVLLPELKTIIRIIIQKRKIYSMTPEDLYTQIYETLKNFDPTFGLSPLIRLFSQYRGVVVNEIREEAKLHNRFVPLDPMVADYEVRIDRSSRDTKPKIADFIVAPEPEPVPDIQQEKTISDALVRLHDGHTLTTREFRLLYAWLHGTANSASLSRQMNLHKQDGQLLIRRALRKIQQAPNMKARFIEDVMTGTVREAAARLGKTPGEVKLARERLKRGAKPRAREGTILSEGIAKVDIFSGKVSEIAKMLGLSERRVYAMRAEQRKKRGSRSHRRSP